MFFNTLIEEIMSQTRKNQLKYLFQGIIIIHNKKSQYIKVDENCKEFVKQIKQSIITINKLLFTQLFNS